MWFLSHSWHRAPAPLEFPKWWETSQCLLAVRTAPFNHNQVNATEVTLGKPVRIESPRGTEPYDQEVQTFSQKAHHPPASRRRMETGNFAQALSDQWFNQLCLHNETSIKKQKERVQRASGLVNTWRCWKNTRWRGHGSSIPLPTYLALWSSSIWLLLSPILLS